MEKRAMMSRRGAVAGAAVLVVAGPLAVAGERAWGLPDEGSQETDGAAPAPTAASERADALPQGDATQLGFLVKARHCVNCQACVRACRRHNGTPAGMPARRKVTVYRKDDTEDVYLSTSCMHCVEPACATVCPAGAIAKGAGGVVAVQPDRCIGCKYCYQACPFGVPVYNEVSMDKCDCCQGNGVALGDDPWCVRACKFDALHFGPLDELLATYEGAQRVEASTKPAFALV